MVFVSIGLRLKVEVEALNMTESLGAYTRHRTVSLLKKYSSDKGIWYKIITVPAISGQSIAHGYHVALVEIADKLGLPVCDECKRYRIVGGFLKHGTAKNIDEKTIVTTCVVEDITGFLAPDAGVRRTSAIMFSYMVPDIEMAETSIDPQFHVRYNFEKNEHNPFQIESGTAIYMLGIGLDVDKIGKYYENNKEKTVGDRDKRIELAYKALIALIEGVGFGAKKARYLPILEVVGAVSTISHPIPFMVSPPRGKYYISETIKRASEYKKVLSDLEEDVRIIYMDKEGLEVATAENVEVKKVESFAELIDTLKNITFEFIRR